jgi:Domain of unknown function (DUF4129)
MKVVHAAQVVDPDNARREAQHILSDRRFRPSSTPRPLRGPLQWLGDRLTSALDHLGNLFGSASIWIWIVLLVAVVTVVAWAISKRVGRRAASAPNRGRAPASADDAESADALERAADAAERDGDLDRAVRLRFRAGLLRLGDRGTITYRPSVTTGEVRRTLASPRFDDLAGTFESITYGGQAADRPDVETARREWPHVLEETGRR